MRCKPEFQYGQMVFLKKKIPLFNENVHHSQTFISLIVDNLACFWQYLKCEHPKLNTNDRATLTTRFNQQKFSWSSPCRD